MPEIVKHKNSDKELATIEAALTKEVADTEEKFKSLQSKREELKPEVYNEQLTNITAKLAELRGEQSMWEKMDKYITKTGDTSLFKTEDKPKNELDVFSNDLMNAKPGDMVDAASLFRAISRSDSIKGAVGDIVIGDVTHSEIFTTQVVEYLLRAPSLLNVISKRPTNTRTMIFPVEDTSKNEGAVASRAAGADFAQIDYGTKQITRACKSVAVHAVFPEELMIDANAAHFLPYVRTRIVEDFTKKIEDFLISGDGSDPNPTGFLTETGVQTLTTVTTGADADKVAAGGVVNAAAGTQKILDYLAGAGAMIEENAFTQPNLILVHPSEYVRFLTLKDDQKQYQLIFNNQVNAPVGGNLPTLWGIPILSSLAVAKKTFIVMDKNRVALYYLAHQPQRVREGYIEKQMIQNKRTIAVDTYMNQYTTRPKAIFKFTRA